MLDIDIDFDDIYIILCYVDMSTKYVKIMQKIHK